MKATYARLKDIDGNPEGWGLRIIKETPFDTIKTGATIVVTKKNGDTKEERVGQILWEGEFQGDAVALCTKA